MKLSDLIARAAEEALWMPDLRDAFAALPGSCLLVLRLVCMDGAIEERELMIPRWETAEEKRFVREFLWASVYNLLSVCSGRALWFFVPPEEALTEALRELPEVFQLGKEKRSGYGKVTAIADRLCRAFGLPPFAFHIAPMESYRPEERDTAPVTDTLASTLRAREQDADRLTLCGVDIGGPDIKLALSVEGKLVCTGEYDWNPAASPTAEEIITPVLEQVRALRLEAMRRLSLPEPPLLDAIGVSFPDIVMDNRILGGETPKTAGIRANPAVSYDREFEKLSGLKELLLLQCRPGAVVRMLNDGNMAAFTAAMELACSSEDAPLRDGLIAHTLGTDLGSGWLLPDGSVPPFSLELYDLILDLGNRRAAAFPPEDLRSTRNENSGLAGTRRYLGQSAAFRLAQELDPGLLDGFTVREGNALTVQTRPEDLRKPCLEHLMQLAGGENPAAETVFRRIGLHFAVLSREAEFLLHTASSERYLYGRFVKSPRCFSLLCEGCAARMPQLRLAAADEDLAASSLMKQLTGMRGITVAQFGQAVGALYYAVPA